MAILWPKQTWSAIETLDLISAGREFEAWLNDPRQYEGQHKRAWISAIDDFCHSASRVGPMLKNFLASDLTQAIVTARSIEAVLNANTEPVLKSLLPGRLPADRMIYSSLKARWPDSASRVAAWQDLVAACRDSATSFDELAIRRDLFWRLIREADFAPEQISQLLAGVLSDIEFYVSQAQLWLEDITEDQVAWPRSANDAGLTDDGLLALCERILIKAPASAHHIVWIAFDHAAPGRAKVDIGGAVSFWNCEWVRDVLKQEGPNLDSIPPELRAKDGLFRYTALPEGRDVVLARVDIGTGAFTDPVRIATEQAEAVVALAGFQLGGTRWRRIEGYLAVVDGRTWSTSTFVFPRDRDDILYGRYQDAMEAELQKLLPRLVSHLPVVDSRLTEVVQAVRWWDMARQQAPLAALLLQVRVLELIASRVGNGQWYDYIESYLRVTWIRRTIIGRLGQTVSNCVLGYERLASETDQQRIRDLGMAITTWPEGTRTLDLRKGIEALADLTSAFPRHDQLGRQVQSIARRLESPATLMSWCDELSAEWRLICGRLRRLRNSLAHGGPIEGSSVATVHQFGQHLAARSLSIALEGLLDGKGIVLAHDEHKQVDDTWWSSISSASSTAEALLG